MIETPENMGSLGTPSQDEDGFQWLNNALILSMVDGKDAVQFVINIFHDILYNGVKYWLLNGVLWPFPFPGYRGMAKKDICTLLTQLPSSHFESIDGTANKSCSDIIHQEVTSRTTVVLTVMMTVMITLFIVFGTPSFFSFIQYLWCYRDKQRKEREAHEANMFDKQEEVRRYNANEAKKANTVAKKKITDDTNMLVKSLLQQMTTILGQNNHDSNNKVHEMRLLLDHIYDERRTVVHYEKVIDLLRWVPKQWKIKGESSGESIICQLNNAIANDRRVHVFDDEDDDM